MELDSRIMALENRIFAWKKQLNRFSQAVAPSNGSQDKKTRRTKAECLKAVEAAMSSPAAATGVTIRQIADETGLPWSTTRNVLQRQKDRYEERDGLWVKVAQKSSTRIAIMEAEK